LSRPQQFGQVETPNSCFQKIRFGRFNLPYTLALPGVTVQAIPSGENAMITFQAALSRLQHPILGPIGHRITVRQAATTEVEPLLQLRGTTHHAVPVPPRLVETVATGMPQAFETATRARQVQDLAIFAAAQGYSISYTRHVGGDGILTFLAVLEGEPIAITGGGTAVTVLGHADKVIEPYAGAFGAFDAADLAGALTAVIARKPLAKEEMQFATDLLAVARWVSERTTSVGWVS